MPSVKDLKYMVARIICYLVFWKFHQVCHRNHPFFSNFIIYLQGLFRTTWVILCCRSYSKYVDWSLRYKYLIRIFSFWFSTIGWYLSVGTITNWKYALSRIFGDIIFCSITSSFLALVYIITFDYIWCSTQKVESFGIMSDWDKQIGYHLILLLSNRLCKHIEYPDH